MFYFILFFRTVSSFFSLVRLLACLLDEFGVVVCVFFPHQFPSWTVRCRIFLFKIKGMWLFLSTFHILLCVCVLLLLLSLPLPLLLLLLFQCCCFFQFVLLLSICSLLAHFLHHEIQCTMYRVGLFGKAFINGTFRVWYLGSRVREFGLMCVRIHHLRTAFPCSV